MLDNQASPRVFRYRLLLAPAFLFACCAITWVRGGAQPNEGPERTKTGIDVLEEQHFAALRRKRVGLITNQTGVDAKGRRTIDVLAHAEGVKLVAVFSPEHGVAGKVEDTGVVNSLDSTTGLPIYSLYGETRRPTQQMLANVDALVFDIQDAGVRFYTYITTMGYAMEEAAKRHIGVFVLDRPNPLGGEVIEGPMLDQDRLSFVGYFPMPVRYAMTIGELAQMFNAENKIGADLHIIAMDDWHRSEIFADTGLKWIPPSPNLRTLDETFLYPGIEPLQAGGVSVGRGTIKAFEFVGAPWLEPSAEFADELEGRQLPGVRFFAAGIIPLGGPYAGQMCHGAFVFVTDPATFRSARLGIELADALHRMFPAKFQLDKTIFLIGSQSTIERIKRKDAPANIIADWEPDLEKFRVMRQKYLLYH
jgi:uncharacterized protein YbbC (DUF1343 family)